MRQLTTIAAVFVMLLVGCTRQQHKGAEELQYPAPCLVMGTMSPDPYALYMHVQGWTLYCKGQEVAKFSTNGALLEGADAQPSIIGWSVCRIHAILVAANKLPLYSYGEEMLEPSPEFMITMGEMQLRWSRNCVDLVVTTDSSRHIAKFNKAGEPLWLSNEAGEYRDAVGWAALLLSGAATE